jgi:O-glycosyl hydrolase
MRRLLFIFLVLATSCWAQTVNWVNTHQAMDGITAGDDQVVAGSGYLIINSTQADSIFSATGPSNNGYSWMRPVNWFDGQIDDLPYLQAVVARGGHIALSIQSPTPSLKASGLWGDGSLNANGTSCFKTSPSESANMTTWANTLNTLLSSYASNGVPVEVLIPFNEPNNSPNVGSGSTYFGQCAYNATGIDTFIKILGPILAAGSNHPKISIADTSGWFQPDDVSTCLNDATCAQYVTYISSHNYSGGNAIDGTGLNFCCATAVAPPTAVVNFLNASSTHHLWMTETNYNDQGQGTQPAFRPAISDAMIWAHQLYDYLTIPQVSNWQYWAQSWSNNFGYWDQNQTVAKRFYAIGNWARFVRPGWVRIDVSNSNPQNGVFITAFKDPIGGGFAIVVQNCAGNTVPTPGGSVPTSCTGSLGSISQTINLSGFPTIVGSQVTPYLTDVNNNLSAQTPISAGSSFTYTLPQQSVVTFVGSTVSFPWSGIVNASRATDWSRAGVVGGIPSASWTQCGSTIAAGASVATINTALASCAGQNKFVLLGPGTFNMTGTIFFPAGGHVVLRGSGANSTFLVVPGSGMSGCQLGSTAICIQSSDQTFSPGTSNTYAWTAGYTQGTNQITLSSTTNLSTTNPTLLFMEQCETGFTTTGILAACTGTSTDNGQLFTCSTNWSATGPVGCVNNGPGNQLPFRGHAEMTYVSSILGNVVTIGDTIRYPDWSASQTPRIWFVQPIVFVGVENLAIDDVANGSNDLVQFFNAFNYWVKGCRFSNWGRWAVEQQQVVHGTVADNYFYHSTGSDSYGIRLQYGGNNLFQNNIITQVFAPVILDGPSAADVIAYNYVENDNYPSDFMRGLGSPHSVNTYELYEGNVVNDMGSDGSHGTNTFNSRYRNFSLGWDSCANGQCGANTFKDSQTDSIIDMYADRYMNNVANVLGTPGYHTIYTGLVSCFTPGYIYIPGCSNIFPTDPLTQSTAMFWDSYDVVTNGIRCNNAEVPTGAPVYPNSIPTLGCSGGALPPSFYLPSTRPSWWLASIPYPAVGPDVSNGNVGQCSGVLNTAGHQSGLPALTSAQCVGTSLTTPAWGGHVNAIPAMACYLNVMGGHPDATGSVLSFNAANCYSGTAGPVPVFTPSSFTYPPTLINTTALETITLANNGSATPVLNVSFSISGAGYSIVPGGNCGTTLGGGSICTVVVQFAPTAITTYNGILTETDNINHVSATTTLSGSGVSPAVATLTPNPVAFGNQAQSTTSAAITVTLTNTGNSPLTLNSGACPGASCWNSITGTNASDFNFVTPATPTWTVRQTAPNSCSSTPGSTGVTVTCTATFASTIIAGHNLFSLQSMSTADTNTPQQPVHNATTGDSDTWTNCPSSVQSAIQVLYRAAEHVWVVTNCDYVGSATGGGTTVTSSYTMNSSQNSGSAVDIVAVEAFPSTGSMAIDAGNTLTSSSCAASCNGAAISSISGTSDLVLTWAASGVSFSGINAPYSPAIYTENNSVQGSFADALNQSAITTPVWTTTPGGTQQSVFATSTLALTSTVLANACSSGLMLNAAQTCNLQVTCTPSASGVRNATLNINANANGSVPMTCTGTGSTAAIPVFGPPGGTYTSSQTVSITSATSGSTDIYTTDGTAPSDNGSCTATGTSTAISNGGTITVSVSQTVKAYACKTGFINSPTATAVYVIQAQVNTALTPTSSLAAGKWIGAQTTIVSSGTTGSTIVYTKDGTVPTDNGSCAATGTSFAVATGSSVSLTTSLTLNMYACKSGLLNSPVSSTTFSLYAGVPIFSPGSAILGLQNPTINVTILNQTSSSMCLTSNLSPPAGSGGTCTNGTLISSGSTQTVTLTANTPSVTLFANSTDVNLLSSNPGGATYTLSLGIPWLGLLF